MMTSNTFTKPKEGKEASLEEQKRCKDALDIEMATYMPFVKLENERYVIGTHIRSLQLKGNGCLVRCGGGYMELDEYLKHYSKSECILLSTLMRKGDGTVKNTVVKMLEQHKVDKPTIQKYEKRCPSEIDEQFKRLMDEVKDFEEFCSIQVPASLREHS